MVKLRVELKKRNSTDIIVYKENVIATFTPLTNFGHQQPIHNERAIDPTNSFECDLLARLIKETLLVTGQNLQLKRVRGKLQINDSKDIQGVIIYPMLSFHQICDKDTPTSTQSVSWGGIVANL